jgi:hypothetical protein
MFALGHLQREIPPRASGWVKPDKNAAQRVDPSQKRMAAVSGMTQTRSKSGPRLHGRGHWGWPLASSLFLPWTACLPPKTEPLAHIFPTLRRHPRTGDLRRRPPTSRRRQTVRQHRTWPSAFACAFATSLQRRRTPQLMLWSSRRCGTSLHHQLCSCR